MGQSDQEKAIMAKINAGIMEGYDVKARSKAKYKPGAVIKTAKNGRRMIYGHSVKTGTKMCTFIKG